MMTSLFLVHCLAIFANIGILTFGANYRFRIKSSRIVGGVDARKGEYPWQISLRYRHPGTEDNEHMCGGSIIEEQWIVTASHCFSGDQDPSNFYIVAGEHDTSVDEGTEQIRNVKRIILHEDFEEEIGQNDVALMELDVHLTFNKFVQPIAIPTTRQYDLFEGNEDLHCVTSGWGKLEFQGEEPYILQTLDMPLLPLDECRYAYSKETVTDDMLCTGHQIGHVNPCQGDSGGPLACNVNGKWILAAVGSWGEKCGTPGFPVVYTRMSAFYDWIKHKLDEY